MAHTTVMITVCLTECQTVFHSISLASFVIGRGPAVHFSVLHKALI